MRERNFENSTADVGVIKLLPPRVCLYKRTGNAIRATTDREAEIMNSSSFGTAVVLTAVTKGDFEPLFGYASNRPILRGTSAQMDIAEELLQREGCQAE